MVRKIRSCVRGGRFSSPQIPVGIGDDAALFRPRPRGELVLTCDWFLEGTHFLRDKHPADSVGWKCLARALSDVAAMGGVPRCFLLSLTLPSSLTGRWLDEFLVGLQRASRKFQCVLVGGDTTRNEKVLINVTVVGEVRTGRAALRSGARPGDVVFVSGRLGEAELGLRVLRHNKRAVRSNISALKRHFYPEPRLVLGRWLAEKRLATSMMDLSDGLSADLPRLCTAAGVGARINEAQIPAPQIPLVLGLPEVNPVQLALHGGDDYELLFTVGPNRATFLPRSFAGIPLTAIGLMTREKRIMLVDPSGRQRRLDLGGWDPFRTER